MKNSLKISAAGEDLLSTADDGTNRLFINGTEISSASWTGSGTYTDTVAGHAITIAQVEDTSGNIALRKTGSYTYELYKITGSMTVSGDLTVTGSISEGGTPLSLKYLKKLVNLWTNPNIGSSFNAQTVQMNDAAENYSLLLIRCRYQHTTDCTTTCVVFPTGTQSLIAAQQATGTALGMRDVTFSGTSAIFSTGRYQAVNSEGTSNPNLCVPIEIYGIA